MGNLPELMVKHNSFAMRFEVEKDGLLAVLEYQLDGGQIVFTHTEVPETLAGQGIASLLARTGLDYARAHFLTVLPLCSFVAGYIRKHLEYQDLVK